MKFPISVNIIGLNESFYLERLMENIKDKFSEIIYVDGGSEDNSIQIAKKYGCRVFEKIWDYNYSKQRNYGIEQCKNDWIFTIDCDELIYDDVFNSLDNIDYEKYRAVSFPRKDFLYEKDLINMVSEVYSIRLFRKELRYHGYIHENIGDLNPLDIFEIKDSWIHHVKSYVKNENQQSKYYILQPWGYECWFDSDNNIMKNILEREGGESEWGKKMSRDFFYKISNEYIEKLNECKSLSKDCLEIKEKIKKEILKDKIEFLFNQSAKRL
jgi:glycosyltransferase involved in cell wall biosynthesis